MPTDILGTLFGSPARVKMMRLFLLNPKTVFPPSKVVSRSSVSSGTARRELALLSRAGFIVRRKERRAGKASLEGWSLNSEFEYLVTFKELLFATEFIDINSIGTRLKRTGRIKLLLLSGIFLRDQSSRLDILLVGDNLKRPAIDRIIRSLEAEIGKELSYTIFETAEFVYRANMYDKLIRDVIDFPNKCLIDTAGLLQQIPKLTTRG